MFRYILLAVSRILLDRFSGDGDSRNPLQVICKSNVRPPFQHFLDPFGDCPADLEYEPASGLECVFGLWNEAVYNLQPCRSGEHRVPRLELAHLELDGIFFGLANIRGIGNHEVKELGWQSGEQIDTMKLDSRGQVEASRVGAGNLQSLGGDICRMDLSSWQLRGQGQSDRPRSGADIHNTQVV